MGGDSTNAATWFLFNLWVSLKALGHNNIDEAIAGYKSNGLNVPAEVGPGNWWTGGYISWYATLSGADVMSMAQSTIDADMPESVTTVFTGSTIPATNSVNTKQGYSLSLCNWGSLGRYQPQQSSCFGKGTMVLMADGTTKPIETVQVGEQVMSSAGPRKISMIETPRRAGRSLFRINDLQCYATNAHPYRAADEAGPMRYAVDPWALLDGMPTMSEKGVGTLEQGKQVSAMSGGHKSVLAVTGLTELAANDDPDERVYDLLLDGWSRDYPAFYVGGPEHFVAVEAETADPLFEPAVTVAVVKAMEMVKGCCCKHLGEPHLEIPKVLRQINLKQVVDLARKAVRTYLGGKPLKRPGIPDLSFFEQQGDWDAHTSMLEYYLVREYSRWLRAEIANGWRQSISASHARDTFVVGLTDLEFSGDTGIPATDLTIKLTARGFDFKSGNGIGEIRVAGPGVKSWYYRIDDIAALGVVESRQPGAHLHGEIRGDDHLLGYFGARIDKQCAPRMEHLVFDPQGHMIGRIGVDLRYLTGDQLDLEQEALSRWDKQQRMALALTLGQQLGHQIRAQMEAHASCD